MGNQLFKILFMAAQPEDNYPIQSEFDIIETKKRNVAPENRILILSPKLNTTYEALLENLGREEPNLLHYSGHSQEDGISLIDGQTNNTRLFTNDELVDVFNGKSSYLKFIFLNSCRSAIQAQIISTTGICVLGINDDLEPEVAKNLTASFYHGLLSSSPSNDIEYAIKQGFYCIIRKYPDYNTRISLWKDGTKILHHNTDKKPNPQSIEKSKINYSDILCLNYNKINGQYISTIKSRKREQKQITFNIVILQTCTNHIKEENLFLSRMPNYGVSLLIQKILLNKEEDSPQKIYYFDLNDVSTSDIWENINRSIFNEDNGNSFFTGMNFATMLATQNIALSLRNVDNTDRHKKIIKDLCVDLYKCISQLVQIQFRFFLFISPLRNEFFLDPIEIKDIIAELEPSIKECFIELPNIIPLNTNEVSSWYDQYDKLNNIHDIYREVNEKIYGDKIYYGDLANGLGLNISPSF